MGARLVGARELGESLAHACDALADMSDVNTAAAQLIAAAAAARAPKRTGRLAGAGRSDGSPVRATVTFGGTAVPYAPVIHWGWSAHRIRTNPFVSNAAQATESQWAPMYEAKVADVIGAVRGA